jgi:diaminohydroxyphosphoribosylaminopyrimidine deaminase/5-amino-6-(5-phosphoribosylamino)uracil reductase
VNFTAEDHRWMARAIRLAWKGRYTTDPNPRVGCVLVRDGQVVGEGWHRRAGEPHAERIALEMAGEQAGGATVYVTLEPCSHHGRTPPCADALVAAGVSRVVAAMEDPNPRVSGKGLKRLREAGIEAESGLLESEARKLNPGFLKRMRRGLPWVRCKLAMSLDGRTAMASGESVWITGEEARRDVQRLRARSSAIVTGIGTVLADDPSLNVRLPPEQLPGVESPRYLRQPVRVVLDSGLRIPEQAKLLGLSGETWIFHAHGDEEKAARRAARGACLFRLEQGIYLPVVMEELARREINEVLIEAGPTLAGGALRSGVIDELVFYMAPHLMGHGARGLFHLPGLEKMEQRLPLKIEDIRAVGRDWRITARPAAWLAQA